MKKYVLIISLVLAAVSLLVACGQPTPPPTTTSAPPPKTTTTTPPVGTTTTTSAPPSGQTVTWTFDFDNPSQTHFSIPLWGQGQRFDRLLTQYSGGRFKLDVKQRLFPSTEQIQAISENRAQAGELRVDWNAGTFPLFDISAIPGLFVDPWAYEKFELDPAVIKIWDTNYRKVGLVKLGSFSSDAVDLIWAHKPVNTVDSLKGLKTRTPGLVGTQGLTALGAAPLTIGDADFDEAFIRGTVDAAVSGTSYGLARNLFATAEYFATWPFAGTFEIPLIANAKAYDALPADLKKNLNDAVAEMSRQEYYGWKAAKLALNTSLSSFKKAPAVPSDAEKAKFITATAGVADWWVKTAGGDAAALLALARKYTNG